MRLAAVFTLSLTACAATGPEPASIYQEPARTQPQLLTERPDYPGYGEVIGAQPLRWSAKSVARDFDRLIFQREWGDKVSALMKWEDPVTVALATPELVRYRPFLDAFLQRIRSAAPNLAISSLSAPRGDITLRNAPRAQMIDVAEDALCFFIPFDVTWEEYKALDASGGVSWDDPDAFDAITIFIPAYAAPYEVRACILEEITQALGPGNDLSDLDDSIFNDDNAHVWPTSFDFLILRTLYQPTLRNGATPQDANARALQQLQTETLGAAQRRIDQLDAKYDHAIDVAENDVDAPLRRQAARAAISLAQTQGAAPHRLGEAYRAASFVAFEAADYASAIDYLLKAERAHALALDPASVHLARVRSELAINLINLEQFETGLALLDLAAPVFAANGLDWQLAHAMRWRAIALSQSGRWAEASGTALEALDWARYVYGGDSRAVAGWRQEFLDIGLIGA